MKKLKIFCIASALTMLFTALPVGAANTSDITLEKLSAGYEWSGAAWTKPARKDNTTGVYVRNDNYFDYGLSVHAASSLNTYKEKNNQTHKQYAIIPQRTERLVYNNVRENGYQYAALEITHNDKTRKDKSLALAGYWSPDSVGDIPYAGQ